MAIKITRGVNSVVKKSGHLRRYAHQVSVRLNGTSDRKRLVVTRGDQGSCQEALVAHIGRPLMPQEASMPVAMLSM